VEQAGEDGPTPWIWKWREHLFKEGAPTTLLVSGLGISTVITFPVVGMEGCRITVDKRRTYVLKSKSATAQNFKSDDSIFPALFL
jgi:hypothetical protein